MNGQDVLNIIAKKASTSDVAASYYPKSHIDSTLAACALSNNVYDKAFVESRLSGLFAYFNTYTQTIDLYTKT